MADVEAVPRALDALRAGAADYVRRALQEREYERQTARLLGISRHKLFYMLKDHELS